MANPFSSLVKGIDNYVDMGYEATREAGSRLFNNNKYNANMPSDVAQDFTPTPRMSSPVGTQQPWKPAPTLNRDGSVNNSGAYSGGSAGGAGGAADADTAYELASMDEQERMLREFITGSGTKYDQGMTKIGDDFNRLRGQAGEQNARAQRNYNIKEEDTTMSKQSALGRVDQNANVLNNSLRQRIGRAAGGSNSAMGVASNAVAREASGERGDVLDSFGQNFRDLGLARKDTEEDYNSLLGEYDRQKNDGIRDFRSGFEGQMQDAWGKIGDIQRQREALRGGGIDAIRRAGEGANAEVSRRSQAIDSLFNQYRNPYQARDVKTTAPNLRDYVTDRAQITQGQQQAGQAPGASPYAKFLQPQDEEEKAQLF